MSERVAVVGAGSWGTAMATLVAASNPATLWARSPDLASAMGQARENATYLPGIQLPDDLLVTSSFAEALDGARIVFMAVPSHGFRAVLSGMAAHAGGVEAVVSLAKGIEIGTNLRMSQVVAEVLPGMPGQRGGSRPSGSVRRGPSRRRPGAPGARVGAYAYLPHVHGDRRGRL